VWDAYLVGCFACCESSCEGSAHVCQMDVPMHSKTSVSSTAVGTPCQDESLAPRSIRLRLRSRGEGGGSRTEGTLGRARASNLGDAMLVRDVGGEVTGEEMEIKPQ
jgi:hypothetical protein